MTERDQTKMTNSEARMTNAKSAGPLRHSDFVILSSFVLRHSAFVSAFVIA